MVKTLFLFGMVLLTNATDAYSQEPQLQDTLQQLSGVLPTVIEKGVYGAKGDIFVSPGSSVTIAAGTVILFQEFSGLHVQGTLYVQGTLAEPVVFTTKNDSLYKLFSTVPPAPFDWNGIDIYETAAGSKFSYCKIQYSVYGIRSQTEYIRLDTVTFTSNGKSDFSILNERKTVELQPYSYFYETPQIKPEIIDSSGLSTVESTRVDKKPELVPEAPKPVSIQRAGRFFRYTGLVLFVGGGIAGGYYTDQYLKARSTLDDLSELDEHEKYTYTSKDWIEAHDYQKKRKTLSSVAVGVGCVGLTLFLVSFYF